MIMIWDTQSKEKLGQLKGHSGSVYALKQANDPDVLFSGGYDNRIIQWSVSKGNALNVFKGFYTYLTCMSFSGDYRFLYSVHSGNCNFIK